MGLKDLDMCDKCTYVTKLSQRGREGRVLGRGGLIRGIMPVPGQMKQMQGDFLTGSPLFISAEMKNANDPTGAAVP